MGPAPRGCPGDDGMCMSIIFPHTEGWALSALFGDWKVGCLGPGPWCVKSRGVSALPSMAALLRGAELGPRAWQTDGIWACAGS